MSQGIKDGGARGWTGCSGRSTLGAGKAVLKQAQKSLQGRIREGNLAEFRYAVERDRLFSKAWFGCDLGPEPIWRYKRRRLLWVVEPDRDRVENARVDQVVDQRLTTAVDRHAAALQAHPTGTDVQEGLGVCQWHFCSLLDGSRSLCLCDEHEMTPLAFNDDVGTPTGLSREVAFRDLRRVPLP